MSEPLLLKDLNPGRLFETVAGHIRYLKSACSDGVYVICVDLEYGHFIPVHPDTPVVHCWSQKEGEEDGGGRGPQD